MHGADMAEAAWEDGYDEPEVDGGPVPHCELCGDTAVCPECGGRVTNGWDAFEALRPLVREMVDLIRAPRTDAWHAELRRLADVLDRVTAGF